MDRRWLDRTRVLARAWGVHRPRRVGRVRTAAAVLGLVAGSGAAYTVQAGDTLSELAAGHGVSVDSLVEANSINDPDHIVVGQVLTIPGQAAGAAAPAAPSSSGGGEASTHVVGAGESLGTIARSYGLSVQQLAAANGITDVNSVWAGTLLRVAAEPPPPPGTGGGTSAGGAHTVAPGESLSGIAARYGSTVGAIVETNGLVDANRIVAGQTLQVPGASRGGSGAAWACPVPGGTYVNDFGVAKPDSRYHEGIDVFAPAGTLVRAPVGGTIEHVQGERAGLQFTLRGNDGYTYVGTHLDAYGPSGHVEQGDPIGTVGTSGNAQGTSPHLHIEMHHGSVVNPYPTLQQYC